RRKPDQPHCRSVSFAVAALIVLVVATAVFGQVLQIEGMEGRTIAADPNYFPYGMGGWVGTAVYGSPFEAGFFQQWLSMVGTLVVFGILAAFSVFFLFGDNLLGEVSTGAAESFRRWKEGKAERRKAREERKRLAQLEREAAAKARASAPAKATRGSPPAEDAASAPGTAKGTTPEPFPTKPGFSPFGRKGKKGQPAAKEAAAAPAKVAAPAPFPAPGEDEEALAPDEPSTPAPAARPSKAAAAPPSSGELRIIASEQTRKAATRLPDKRGNYVFPPMKLLLEPPAPPTEDTSSHHQETAEALVRTLEEFGVKVTMGEVHAGPVITRYDVYPAPGVRVERIANLDKNLALGLKALSVRILAPVPGKGCVGIEVPNKQPQAVFIRDILESEDWVDTKAEIPIALGKEVSGKPLVTDLTKMPHLLIAGSTGSGKTVCINSVITSLLYHSSPDDLRFVMVDPKIVEMQVYNKLPHMLIPVVTDPKKVPNALKYLLNEMERRYQMFAEVGVRNIAGFNAKMARNRSERATAEALAAELDAALTPEERAASASAVSVPRDPDLDGELPTKLPYVVCIVDELADLMMVAPADIETGIARLAQLARAAGIHLILATQRPSVNVITGVIKANLPSRISFKVASKVDSRTILDGGGADQLIGKGDMLFLPPGSADLVRSQGAFVGDDEIAGIVDYIAEKNGEPEFDEQFQRTVESGDDDEGGAGAEGNWDDDLVPNAIEVIRTSKRASTSMLQRRLKIGYNRAARIMEILEDEGIVGPENGSSPREILRDLDAL
ncbi:MAG: DNA translocase FtsK, partial [Opitutales bacterium]